MKTVDPGIRLTPTGRLALRWLIIIASLALCFFAGTAIGEAAPAEARCTPITIERNVSWVTCTLGRCGTEWSVKLNGQRYYVDLSWFGRNRVKVNDHVTVSACLPRGGATVKGRLTHLSRYTRSR